MGALINKHSKGGAYWKEGAKSDNYGFYFLYIHAFFSVGFCFF